MKAKKILDARKLPRDAKEMLRIAAVRRVQAGESPEAVASGIGINRRQIYRWIQKATYGGEDALKSKPIPGAPPKLSAQQMQKLATIVREDNPLQHKFEFALWTLAMIRTLILQQFQVRLSEVSVGRLMRRLGYSPQRPLYKAWQQDPVLVQSWRHTEYPKIAAQAKKENALIFFADEAGIRSDHHAGTSWAPVGQTPVVKSTGARYGMNLISAVNAMGHFRFMVIDGNFNASVFKEFLKRLIQGLKQKVLLIVDGHPAHKAKLVRDFVQANSERIELFILPPYSPELNPDELVWAHIKARVAKQTAQTKVELIAKVKSAMHRLVKLPKVVAGFFQTPTCSYAAA